jgi:hypothetical protein
MEVETAFADDVLYLEWKAGGVDRQIDDGMDTFVLRSAARWCATQRRSYRPTGPQLLDLGWLVRRAGGQRALP